MQSTSNRGSRSFKRHVRVAGNDRPVGSPKGHRFVMGERVVSKANAMLSMAMDQPAELEQHTLEPRTPSSSPTGENAALYQYQRTWSADRGAYSHCCAGAGAKSSGSPKGSSDSLDMPVSVTAPYRPPITSIHQFVLR